MMRNGLMAGTVLAGSMLAGALALSGSALAAGDVFTVGNYPVDAVAANAVEAKDRAIKDGQTAALRSVLKRLAPVTYFERLRQLKLPPAETVLESVQVRSERNSQTEYIAEIDITFNADNVRGLLRQNGVPFVDSQAPLTTLVAIYRQPAAGAARAYAQAAGDKLWREVWLGLDLENAIAPSVLERLRPTVHSDTVQMVLEGSGGGDRILRGEYGRDQVVLVVAEPDPARKRIKLTIAGRDAVGPLRLVRELRFDPADFAYAMELAAVVTQGILDGRWKAVQLGSAAAAPASPATYGPTVAAPQAQNGWNARTGVGARVVFQSIADWRRIQTALEATPGVSRVDVNGLTPRAADVTIQYNGDGNRLAGALARQGLTMQQVGGGGWLIR
jgi:hypothetical protein